MSAFAQILQVTFGKDGLTMTLTRRSVNTHKLKDLQALIGGGFLETKHVSLGRHGQVVLWFDEEGMMKDFIGHRLPFRELPFVLGDFFVTGTVGEDDKTQDLTAAQFRELEKLLTNKERS